MVAKSDRQRESTAQTGQHVGNSFVRRFTIFEAARQQVGYHFAIRIAFHRATGSLNFVSQFLVIFDDPVVDYRYIVGRMRMSIACRRRAMGGPAGVRDTDIAGRGIAGENLDQIGKLAFSPAADQFAAIDRADPGAVISAIFHPLQPVDEPIGYRFLADNSDNSAHYLLSPLWHGR